MVSQLQQNIERLISAYETQKSRADKLDAELAKYKSQSEAAKGKINELEDKVDTLSLRTAFSPTEGGNEEAVMKIDRLIREIDKALEMLEQQ